eukprot:68250_1
MSVFMHSRLSITIGITKRKATLIIFHEIKYSFSTKLIHDYIRSGNMKGVDLLWNNSLWNNRDIKLYGVMMSAYIKHNQCDKCFELFNEINKRQIKINDIIYLTLLKACHRSNNFEAAKLIHFDIMKHSSIYKNIKIQNCLIDIYTKFDTTIAYNIYNNLTNDLKLTPNAVTYINV